MVLNKSPLIHPYFFFSCTCSYYDKHPHLLDSCISVAISTRQTIIVMTNKMSWSSFPAEIRLIILKFALSAGSTAGCSSVCKEWQAAFEKKHFERIILSQQDISDFALIMQGSRWQLVKHIWLRIVLGTYLLQLRGMQEAARYRNNSHKRRYIYY
ncbi:hypothetical protein F4781DRAFT_152972 [Annulohypoxylon bovei var. microspora]|nr:hypothetical protein F4781DRAFT_152972 [Annulohypoxylon bovei var. microspora]